MIALAGIVISIVIILAVLWMLLTRRLREKYAALWLVIAFIVLVVGIFPGMWEGLTRLLGVQLPSNLLFAAAILLLLGVTFHLSWELSGTEEEIRRLAEESAILRARIEELGAQFERSEVEDQDGPNQSAV